jgi:hypothetical protein
MTADTGTVANTSASVHFDDVFIDRAAFGFCCAIQPNWPFAIEYLNAVPVNAKEF